MLRIIHAADLHLDSPFEGLGSKAAQRRSEQRELLGRITALAREKSADLLLLSGDLLDTGSAYAETGRALCRLLGGAGCPVFVSPGNHDYYSASSPYARLPFPENVHIFKRNEPECVTLPDLGASVWGAAFVDSFSKGLLRGFHAEKSAGTFNIGVFHGDAETPDSKYGAISASDISGSGLDYLALGHIHSFSGLKKEGATFYAYPGCPEGRGFDERGEKGVVCVELSEKGCRAEFVPVCMRKYELLEMELPAGELAGALPTGTENDIYRIVLTGECEAPPDLARLYEQLKERFFALQLVDKTTVRRDIWEMAEQDSLRGLFLRKMRAKLDGARDDDERETVMQAVRWGLAALDGGEAVREC